MTFLTVPPKHLKKKFRTTEGLKIKIKINKIRWNWRNVLNIKDKKFTILDYNFTNSITISFLTKPIFFMFEHKYF